jgi:mannose-6-phosphate isomerase class I
MPEAFYDKRPCVHITGRDEDCRAGWQEIGRELQARMEGRSRLVVAVECYPGVLTQEVEHELCSRLRPDYYLAAEQALLSSQELDALLGPYLTDDPVFGRMRRWSLAEYFDPKAVATFRETIAAQSKGLILIVGAGAALLARDRDLLIYADLPRWEIQQRYRKHRIGNLGADNLDQPASALYKRAYFADWRAADEFRSSLFPAVDYLLDTTKPHEPRMVPGELYRAALATVCRRPFRVVPFFDPGPWGGQWMRRRFQLPEDAVNYAWCFDCVPEENSLLLAFGSRQIEVPALNLVHQHPEELLGAHILARFGAEFPIRFDFLDTVEGGNLSLQVHPLRSFIADKFGMSYTQDESYYLLDAEPEACVYLGLKEGVDPRQMAKDLRAAEAGDAAFPAEKYVNRWPVRKHSHVSIPAGTIHCSGRGGVVLEISATPYIFTFKLWDWGRTGLDGYPRPLHLEYGLENIQWDRTTEWVRRNLIDTVRVVARGEGWREEATGLHATEFLETRRHWFTGPVEHNTEGTLNVLNLVEGEQAMVESPGGAFAPFLVHYAETFIVPAAVGRYTIRPVGKVSQPMATIKAYVRSDWTPTDK